jgi:hypothetical protein
MRLVAHIPLTSRVRETPGTNWRDFDFGNGQREWGDTAEKCPQRNLDS